MSNPTAYMTPIGRLMCDVVALENGCWQWQRPLSDGYGHLTFRGEPYTAHVFSWLSHGKTIPDGEQLDHLCRNRACVNPDHLEPVPPGVNTQRGDCPNMRLHISGFCKDGHRMTPDNVYRSNKGLSCKRCCLARANARNARIRAERERG
jgi:hypothetical protein